MKTGSGLTAFWIACYLLLAVGPLAALLLLQDPPPSRGFWIEFSAALGFIALAMFALQFVLTARFTKIGAPHGLDTLLQFHREAGIVAVVFALMHPITMIARAPAYLEFLDPRVMFGRAIMLIGTIVSMLLIVFLTLRRRRLGISYEMWRLSHGLLGLFIVAVALNHIFQVEWYVVERWQRTLWIGLTAGALLLLGHVRVGKPLRMWRRPYHVVQVTREDERTWTLAVEPAGHPGMKFRAGQFAWLTVGPTPFSLQQHPFSFSSSALQNNRIEFTIRELGDFTKTIGKVKPGATAFLEGPYGAFVPDLDRSNGLVLIAGGVGIAPMMSILRTLCDRGDRRRVVLIYSSHDRHALFRRDLESMKAVLNLEIVFVVDDIGADVLETQLSRPQRAGLEYFICGPGPMMDQVEDYLSRAGIPARNIHSERFDIA